MNLYIDYLRCLLVQLIQEILPDLFIQGSVPASDSNSVDPIRVQAEVAGTGDKDFIRLKELLQAERLFFERNIKGMAGQKQVSPGLP